MSHIFVSIKFQPTRQGLYSIVSQQNNLNCFYFCFTVLLGLQHRGNESGFVDFFATFARIRFSVPKKGNVRLFCAVFIVIFVVCSA